MRMTATPEGSAPDDRAYIVSLTKFLTRHGCLGKALRVCSSQEKWSQPAWAGRPTDISSIHSAADRRLDLDIVAITFATQATNGSTASGVEARAGRQACDLMSLFRPRIDSFKPALGATKKRASRRALEDRKFVPIRCSLSRRSPHCSSSASACR